MPEVIETTATDITEQEGIIEVKQLPIIIEQLALVKRSVEDKISAATKMVCTEENYKEIKKIKAALNNEFKEWEEKRKEVKKKIMTPYEKFEEIYKDCISIPYKTGDVKLKSKTDAIENGLKSEKKEKVVKYFKEYAEALGIDFVSFGQVGCNITLSVSEKKLKEQVKAFLDKVMDDISLISAQEHKSEILVEYKRSLNVSQAIMTVNERLKAIEAEKQRELAEQEERAKAESNAAANEAAFEPFVANVPQEIAPPSEEELQQNDLPLDEPQEKIFSLAFRVYGTKSQLKEFAHHIKSYLSERGMRYE